MKKKFIIILFLIVGTCYFGYRYIYKDHRNISEEKVAFSVNSNKLFNEFSKDISGSEIKYLDKTVSVKGIVSELNKTDLILDEKIYCNFNNTVPNNILNNSIQIKGRILGFDELLEVVKLDQCSIVQ